MACAKCGMTMKKGGAKPKKMATGGVTLTQKGAGYAKATTGGTNSKLGIYGMPQENMGTSGQYGKMAKGGVSTSRAVMASCKGGMVRDANGKCVMERKMSKGGLAKAQPGASVPVGTVVKDGRVWNGKGYDPAPINPTPTNTVPVGTVINDGRIWNGKGYDPAPVKGKKGIIVKKKMAKGGATSFGMLSVKAGIDKNPKPTAADRIAGVKKKKRK
jgi:hypothetical protein